MAKLVLEKEILEIILGAALMFLSFLLTLLSVVRLIEPSFILMFLFYSLSLAGLIVGLHGLYTFILAKRPSDEQ
ncbi:MAG: hypothetical protein QXL54_01805 [Candidatus Bathyarchaeia archaeon]